MKTERRHVLETNVLAKELALWIDWVKPYAKFLVGVLLAAAVVFAVVNLVSRQSSRTEAAAWDAYYVATEGSRRNPDELLSVAASYAGTSVEPWAKLAWADGHLRQGSRLLFV